jgi:hypothetical protein
MKLRRSIDADVETEANQFYLSDTCQPWASPCSDFYSLSRKRLSEMPIKSADTEAAVSGSRGSKAEVEAAKRRR